MNRRFRSRGRSLVEVVVVVTLTTVIISQAVVMLSSLLKIQSRYAQQERLTTIAAQFKERWQNDVRQATGATVGDRCELAMGSDKTVVYSRDGENVLREVREGDKIIHRDQFDVQLAGELTFVHEAMPRGTLISLAFRSTIRHKGLPSRERAVAWSTAAQSIVAGPVEDQP